MGIYWIQKDKLPNLKYRGIIDSELVLCYPALHCWELVIENNGWVGTLFIYLVVPTCHVW